MPELILYMTSACHLCEQAQGILLQTLGQVVPEVDIADDDKLLERYGVRIPVLRRLDSDAELDWPFEAEAVQSWLENKQLN